MFEKIKAKIEELKAEIESAVNAEEIKADEAALGLLQGWVDGLTALKKVLEDKEKGVPVPTATSPEEAMAEIDKEIAADESDAPADAAPSEPAQDAKGDASEPPESAESQVQ